MSFTTAEKLSRELCVCVGQRAAEFNLLLGL